MIQFIVASALLLVLVVTVIAWPLLRARQTNSGNLMNMNVDVLRGQMRQIDELHAAGSLTDDAYASAHADLERKIVDAVMNAPAAAAVSRPPLIWMAALVVLLLVVVGGGYAWLGTPLAADKVAAAPAADAQPQAPHALGKEQMADMVQTLAKRLEANPDDADGWGMLARSYAVTGEHAKAVPAFRKAQALRKDDPVLLADFADALAMMNDRRLDGEPTKLIEQALALDPGNLKALSLAGTAAFDRKDYAGAVKYWERLQQSAPADNVFVRQIEGGIAEARQLGGIKAPAAGTAPMTASSQVGGTVSLAAALKGKAAPEDTLFVFARPVDGSRMPLAILRKQVKDLPLNFKLDDSMAMSPAAKLSSHPQVIVEARISKSGQAAAQPGDLQGQSPAVTLGRVDVKIEIAQTVDR